MLLLFSFEAYGQIQDWYNSLNFISLLDIERDNQKHHSREKSNDQTQVAEPIWAGKELLEVIESVTYFEQFIHCFEEKMPRGLGGS